MSNLEMDNAKSKSINRNEFFKYIVVCPAKNEERYIQRTIDSIVRQTLRPVEFIVVNDASMDKTARIIQRYQTKYEWIKQITLKNDKERALGNRVVNNFYVGLEDVGSRFNFLVKMDADISFEPYYFEYLLNKFMEDESLGIAGGKWFTRRADGNIEQNPTPKYSVGGGLKTYRMRCFNDIEGIVPILGWDHIDEMMAMRNGWKTKSFSNLKIIQNRPMGTSIGSIYNGALRWGETAYILRNGLIFILLKGAYHMCKRPFVLRGAAFYYGYLKALIAGQEQFGNKEICDYMRRRHNKRIISKLLNFGKNSIQ